MTNTKPDAYAEWDAFLREQPQLAGELIDACGLDESAARAVYYETLAEGRAKGFARGVARTRARGVALASLAAATGESSAFGAAVAAMEADLPVTELRDDLMLAYPEKAASIDFAHRACGSRNL